MPEKTKRKRTHHPVVREMTDGTRKVYGEVRTIYDRQQHLDMVSKFQMGQFLNSLTSDPQKYGDSPVQQVAEALGLSDDTLYGWASVPAYFEQEEFDGIRKRGRQGFRITFTHLVSLTHVKPRDRAQLIERVFAERMTTRQLNAEVAELLKPAGRTLEHRRRYATPRAGLKTMIAFADQFQSACEGLGSDVFEKCGEIDPKKVDEHLALVIEAQTKEQEMLEIVQFNVQELQGAREALEKIAAEVKEKDRSPQTSARRQPRTEPAAV